MLGNRAWKYFHNNPTGIVLTTVMAHTESSGSAVLYPNGKIRVRIVAASVGKAASLKINTPVAFRVTDFMVLYASAVGATPGMACGVYNNTSAIGSVTAGTGDYIKRPSSLDNTYASFAVDDNDLYVVVSCSSTGTVVVVLDVLFV